MNRKIRPKRFLLLSRASEVLSCFLFVLSRFDNSPSAKRLKRALMKIFYNAENDCGKLRPILKDPSQPPPFSMPSKLLILRGEAKSYCFTVSCVPESMFHYLQ